MTNNEFSDYLKDLYSKSDMEIQESQINDFCIYKETLVEWCGKMNLTAIKDDHGIGEKHFLDSTLLLKYIDVPKKSKMADIGSGAGFPAVPIKIMRNDIDVTMIDSLNKRLIFLNELLNKLNLQGATVHLRGEEAGQKKEFREKFDIVTARAVAQMRELSEYCLPLVKIGGIFAVLKGFEIEEELEQADSAIKLMGGEIQDVIKYDLVSGDKRSIIVIKKISQTPSKFPRPSAKIAKNPI